MRRRAVWVALAATLVIGFTLLGFGGSEIYRKAPPIPEEFSADGTVVATRDQILDGQQAWQSIGGMEVGSIWGHGSYQAPDWTADWLHREALAVLDIWAVERGAADFASLDLESQAALRDRLVTEMRTNTYDPATGRVTLSSERAAAIASVANYYDALFGGAPALSETRRDYAMPETLMSDPVRRDNLTRFFFWTAWAATTDRPGSDVTYTNNWPHEPLVGNAPSTANILWSIGSVVLLLAALGGLGWWFAFRRRPEEDPVPPVEDPGMALRPTPSMRAIGKYVAVVALLLGVQVALGIVTAHYSVEGQSLYGIPLADFLPYAVTRTWHVQIALFWIATGFLAAGLFLAPAVGGGEPRGQRLGVNALFLALLVVVGGSLAGEWLSIDQRLGLNTGFWVGHQGYEYLDLGRLWQIALFVGFLLWLALMLRALWPALRRREPGRALVIAFAGASAAIALMYGSGLLFGARSHLSVMEYWRWWIVHLWVEGFFEVFATAVIAFVFAYLGLVRRSHAGAAVAATAVLYLFGGIPGTFHHLYFSGTPVAILALGASFSALEVIPLVMIGAEAFNTSRKQKAAAWAARYRWPIRFFVAVAFWNLVGAGLFGFLINPPISLYYTQGLNLTPLHGHTALFGVYGMLSLGLVLLVARFLSGSRPWRERPLRIAFWGLNGGLALMAVLSMLPIGLGQAWASIDRGLWYARSAEFMQQDWVRTLHWLRTVGDVVFTAGVVALAWFLFRLWRTRAEVRTTPEDHGSPEPSGPSEPLEVSLREG